jgi:hypothetical protein
MRLMRLMHLMHRIHLIILHRILQHSLGPEAVLRTPNCMIRRELARFMHHEAPAHVDAIPKRESAESDLHHSFAHSSPLLPVEFVLVGLDKKHQFARDVDTRLGSAAFEKGYSQQVPLSRDSKES